MGGTKKAQGNPAPFSLNNLYGLGACQHVQEREDEQKELFLHHS